MTTWAKGTFSPFNPGKGAGGDGESQPSDQKGQGQGSGQTADEIHDAIERKLAKRSEIGSDAEAAAAEEENASKQKGQGPGGLPGQGSLSDLESRKAEIEKIVPKMNWKALIKLMISSSTEKIDTSYAKPSRRGLTGVSIAAQVGAGAIKPGERVQEEMQNKLVLILDTSGSMYDTIPIALAETQVLLKQMGRNNHPITVCFFAGTAKYFQVNLGNNTWGEITDASQLGQTIPASDMKKDWKTLLSSAGSGGTEFSSSMVSSLNTLLSQGYNAMLFSDSDMLYGRNWSNFVSLYTGHKNSVFWICDSLETWRTACKELGQVPKTFSYLQSR
jgi:hypothetical protein